MEQITKPHCGARLDRLPDCRWHSSMFAVVAFGLLVCWSNAVGGLILAQLKELGWTDNSTTATFSAITTAGMFLGALVGGIIGDKTGRRNAFILYEAIHIASMVVGAFSPNMMFLIACRFVMGVGLGALLVTLFAGFTEYMPGRNRGTWSSRVSFIGNWSYPLCSLIAMGLTPLISAEWNWRVQLLSPAVLSLIATALAWRYFPESPRWLESRGRYQEAEKVMQAIEAGIERQTGKPLPPVVIESSGKPPRSVPYSALLTGVLLKRVILGSCVLIAMNVVQYTLINWLPTIFMTQGINLKDSIVLNTMSMFGAPFGIFIAMLVMDKIPRKTMGVGLLILIAVLGYIYSLQTSMLLITLIGFFLITFVYMYVCYASAVYVPEIWPTEAKLRGSGLANAVGRISGIAAPYAVAVLLNGYGVTGVFVLLGAVSIIVAVAIATIGIETKGVSVESLGIDKVTSK
ncbi:MFS transporter [Salmonella enterica subsp. enterica serovar Paratyphi C]|uniref:MFS transporter n=1 Tax=Salmonella enterica TaxID=28901 RepID=A0A5C2LZI6_SALER|nr:MFS transporter [Salmonella enterica]EAB5471449.1 MFS transporter [Salmonella enterica subsp. enterica serovar Typhisuis]ECE6939870.1 MFS transporter [Salmonella enterica subsp. enterica serovar Choleraesuis]EAB5410821.1 MFS transporter [Salmonella enterica subsp. enterica serovar Paratyphi C]EAW5230073.1 MFS transporter [Salmonella enterica subsp. enterica serovar Paratyphi C]EBG9761799.1 MFS transporter [Salmonella enterica]